LHNPILALVTSSVINILMLLILLYLVSSNTIMSVRKTKTYIVVIILTVIVIIAEIATSALDVLGPSFRIPNTIANIIGFSISTCIPVVLAVVFDKKLYRKIKYICIPIILNFVLLICSAWTGWIFYVSMDNHYMRGPLFGVYVLTYIVSLLFLMISNYHQSLQFRDKERVFLMMLYAIILLGTTVQILFPMIHSTWHCITLVLVMYYLFQRELQFKYDTVTKLLNRHAFEKMLEKLSGADLVGIISFDVDNFKEINDTYGHAKGDHCLIIAARIIKNSFKEIGQCYRIGGDEFCVLAETTNEAAINSCIDLMVHSLENARETDPVIPNISFGYSIYNKSKQRDIVITLQEADEKMYACKKNRRLDEHNGKL